MIWLAILGLLVLLLVLVYIWMNRTSVRSDTVVVQEGDWWGGWWGPWWSSGGYGGSWSHGRPHRGRPHHHPGPSPHPAPGPGSHPAPGGHMLGPGGMHRSGSGRRPGH